MTDKNWVCQVNNITHFIIAFKEKYCLNQYIYLLFNDMYEQWVPGLFIFDKYKLVHMNASSLQVELKQAKEAPTPARIKRKRTDVTHARRRLGWQVCNKCIYNLTNLVFNMISSSLRSCLSSWEHQWRKRFFFSKTILQYRFSV